jgi:hypothetical protein
MWDSAVILRLACDKVTHGMPVAMQGYAQTHFIRGRREITRQRWKASRRQ